jgi:hypothetical protein
MKLLMGQCVYLHLSLGISILFIQGHVYDMCVSHDINLVNNVNDQLFKSHYTFSMAHENVNVSNGKRPQE